MKALLDTHVWLWWLFEPARLPARARRVIQDEVCHFSAVSLWEVAIKRQLGKLTMPVSLEIALEQLAGQGILWLALEHAHCLRFEALPLHHRDPFDRMLAAQASEERMAVVSRDSCLDHYGVQRVWE